MRWGARTRWGFIGLLLLAAAAGPQAAGAAGLPRAAITQAPAATVTSATAEIAFAATGPALLARFTCSLDNGPWTPCTSPVRYENLAAGQHGFGVRLEGLGTDTAAAITQWTIDLVTAVVPVPPVVAPAPAPKPSSGCRDAAAPASSTSAARLSRALLCLLNTERGRRHLPRLRADSRLRTAADRHARDMVVNRFFGHRGSGGDTLITRAARYIRGARQWKVGEALHWGEAARSTPQDAMRELLASPPHRRILLSRTLRDAGVAAVSYVRTGSGRPAAVYVIDLGRRS